MKAYGSMRQDQWWNQQYSPSSRAPQRPRSQDMANKRRERRAGRLEIASQSQDIDGDFPWHWLCGDLACWVCGTGEMP